MQRIPALCALLVVGFFAGPFAAGCPEQDEGPDPTGAPLAVVYVDDIGDDQEGSGRQSDPYRCV